jgi:hypothetical protein
LVCTSKIAATSPGFIKTSGSLTTFISNTFPYRLWQETWSLERVLISDNASAADLAGEFTATRRKGSAHVPQEVPHLIEAQILSAPFRLVAAGSLRSSESMPRRRRAKNAGWAISALADPTFVPLPSMGPGSEVILISNP